MKYQIKKTNTNTYLTDNKEILIRDKNTKQFRPMTERENEINTAHKDSIGWTEIEANSHTEALTIYFESMTKKREARKIERAKMAKADVLEWEKLSKLDVIPVTEKNLRIVLTNLSKSNWGSWTLPKMSIGYAAHQYDCDGFPATTIKLNKPLNGHKKYKVGGKMGHLNSYQKL